MDLFHLPVGAIVRDELADVDPGNLRTDDRRELFDADRLVGLLLAACVPVARARFAGERAHWQSSGERCRRIVARLTLRRNPPWPGSVPVTAAPAPAPPAATPPA